VRDQKADAKKGGRNSKARVEKRGKFASPKGRGGKDGRKKKEGKRACGGRSKKKEGTLGKKDSDL